jgi:uncharacterized membrane protein YraQ (UPF0718 family)
MQAVWNMIAGVAAESWFILEETAPYMLLGLFMAGVFRAVVSESFVARHLGPGRLLPVLKASVLGAPMPLCSCGVVPAAAGLRRQGAGKGATAAFLIATPETGVDSVAVTWGLLDPLMAVIRPLAAVITATATGVLVNLVAGQTRESSHDGSPVLDASACASGCCPEGGACASSPGAEIAGDPQAPSRPNLFVRLGQGLHFAFTELAADLGGLLLLGIVLAGAIAHFLPPGLIEQSLGRGVWPMVLMLAAGIPLYVCATSSTPMVAALALKGLTPGAALVFLLAGPVTNMASLTVLSRLLGRGMLVPFLAAVAGVTLALGLATDWIYGLAGADVTGWVQAGTGEEAGWWELPSSLVLLGCIAWARFRSRKGSACAG